MQLIWRGFTSPKYGNRPDENEDAYWPIWVGRKYVKTSFFRCAMADGATQTSFSSLWANLLVREVGKLEKGSITHHLRRSIIKAQNRWKKTIDGYTLPWHAEEKVKQGSFATLLTLSVWGNYRASYGGWQTLAIGDTCIYQIRHHKLLTKFPVESPDEFGNSPILVSSIDMKNSQVWKNLGNNIQFGSWQSGDHFLIMSDALAYWFLDNFEQNRDPFSSLKSGKLMNSRKYQDFENWIQSLRKDRLIRNDDTTLIWLTVF